MKMRFLTIFILIVCLLNSSACAYPTTPDANASPAPKAANPIVIAGPATPSSIPLILAAEKMGNATVQIYQNNAQANTSFLRGEITILVSGLSVGVDMRGNDVPVQVLNSYVTGLSYLVTHGEALDSLSDLNGGEVYLPFEGSPIEEATLFLAQQEGLTWGVDIKPVYSPFDASVVLLKEGKAKAVVLPEPFVSLVENEPSLFISLDYFERWNTLTGTYTGYPQVGSFANSAWAAQNPDQVAEFNAALEDSIRFIQENPEEAVVRVKDTFNLPEAVLLRSLARTHFSLLAGDALQASVNEYYQWIGKPLDDKYTEFYYSPKK